MQKSIFTLILSSSFLIGCAFFSKYSEVEYNNLVVEGVNKTSLAIEETTTLYSKTVPDVVTEETLLDTSEVEDAYEKASEFLEETEAFLNTESRNEDQQNAVRTELEVYQAAAEAYLKTYAEMLEYYSSEAYKTDVTQVEALDEAIHTHYTTFIESNNDLVDALESFVKP